MYRLFAATAIVVSLAAPAAAEDKMVVDMSKLTCGELTKLGFQDFAGVTMWLSGYYNASVRNTTIDLDQFALAAKTVKDYCAIDSARHRDVGRRTGARHQDAAAALTGAGSRDPAPCRDVNLSSA